MVQQELCCDGNCYYQRLPTTWASGTGCADVDPYRCICCSLRMLLLLCGGQAVGSHMLFLPLGWAT
jgi:hypothetical protein